MQHSCYFIDTPFGRTHIIDSGTQHKHVILLLHGSASNSATWMGDVKQWSEYFGGAKDALLDSRKSADRLKRLLSHTQVNLLESVGHVIIDQGYKICEFHKSDYSDIASPCTFYV